MKAKNVLATISAIALSATTLIGAGCGSTSGGKEVDTTKTQLFIATRNSGYGCEWFWGMAEEFEKKYANVSFEEGKKGVQVIGTPDASANASLATNLQKSDYHVIITDTVDPTEMISSNVLMDITDVVQAESSAFTKTDIDGNTVELGESVTLESKLFDAQKMFFAETGKYYILPWTFSYSAITYNDTIWKEKAYYFALDKENASYPLPEDQVSSYTGETYTGRGFINAMAPEKSVGPDGKKGTYDDGMPSSFEEWMYLIDWMTQSGVAPFIFMGGANDQYSGMMDSAITMAYGGKQMQALFDAKSPVDESGNVITSSVFKEWNGNTPVFEDVEINEDNGYRMFQTEARYRALDFIYKSLVPTKYLSPRARADSHKDTQDYFVRSHYQSGEKPIAMLLEGSWWHYEAKAERANALQAFKKQDDLRVLPISRQLTGSVEEGEGTILTLPSEGTMYGFVRKNIESQSVANLAKLFLRYCYTDEMMNYYMRACEMPVSMKYQVTDETYEAMTAYGDAQAELFEAAIADDGIIFPYSTSRTYKNQPAKFQIGAWEEIWLDEDERQAFRYFYYNPDKLGSAAEMIKQFYTEVGKTKADWDVNYKK